MKFQPFHQLVVVTLLAALAFSVRMGAQEPPGEEHHANHHRYKLVDIGTFGGPDSYVNAAFSLGSPNQISNKGTVVGAAATDIPAPPNKQICGGPDGLVPFVFHAFAWQRDELKDLGALPGVECSEAVSVNTHGEIAGRSGNGVIDPLAGVEEIRAVLWKDGEIKDLGTLGGNHSVAIGINNRSEIIGVSVNTIPDPFSLLYLLGGGFTNGTQTRGFLWHNGNMRDLGTLGGPDAQAFGLNERGEAVGISYINSTPNPVTGLPAADPFLWTEDRGMIDLGSLGGAWGAAGAVNNRAQVIGDSSLASDPGACLSIGNSSNCHPFFWNEGKLIDLATNTLGGNPVTAQAINDAGEVVGGAAFSANHPFDAYLWRGGVAMDLGTLPGDCFSEAFAINARGQVVGQSISCDGSMTRSFLWKDGTMFDLNTLIPRNSALELDNTLAISDRGWIAGFGLPANCVLDTACGHAFLLVPCEGDSRGDQECGDERGNVVLGIQNTPGPVPMEETGLTSRDIAARMRARFSRNHLFAAVSAKQLQQK